MSIYEAYLDVRQFHIVFDHPWSNQPRMQPFDRVKARADWLDEEVRELREARTIYEQADAYIDLIYFALGGLVDMGINPAPLWALVQTANMAKVWPDGSVHKREDGKIIKPEGWTPPDDLIHEEINRQLDRDTRFIQE